VTTEAEPTLAGEFPPATEEQWLALVDKVLKGAPLSKLESRTPGGVTVSPLYTAAGSTGSNDEAGFPGQAPFIRGSSPSPRTDGAWAVRARIGVANPVTAQQLALRELARGSTELQIRFDAAFRQGVSPTQAAFDELGGVDGVLIASTKDLLTVLQGVYLDLAAVHLQPGGAFVQAAQMMLEVWERTGVDSINASGGIGADPIGELAATGRLAQGIDAALAELGSLASQLSVTHPNLRTVSVDTAAYVEAGCSETGELAAMLSTAAAYLRAMSAAGMTVDAACAQIEVTLSVDADVFTGIAQLRAARRLWSEMTAACGASESAQALQLHVRTAERMMTKRDPWVNLLRVTSATFAACLGGAASVTTLPFDIEAGEPEELGQRMARNTQLLLQEESNLGRVIDPTGGSWYVESLTDEIAVTAWRKFGEIESAGGLPAALLDGTLPSWIAEVCAERQLRVATRREPITGVSEFPDIHEAPLTRAIVDLVALRAAAEASAAAENTGVADVGVADVGVADVGVADVGVATTCAPLPRVRWSEPFELLRDRSDAFLASTGRRPEVFLVNLGPVSVHTGRASFAKNFFEAGGIAAASSERGETLGFDQVADAVADALQTGCELVCICSSDALYAERATEFAEAFRATNISTVYLAGNPGDRRAAEVAAGITEFIHVGVNLIEVLNRALSCIETASIETASIKTARTESGE